MNFTSIKKRFGSSERWGNKSIDNLLEGIEKSKEQPFNRVLFGLGIRFIGQRCCKLLAKHFSSLEKLSCASKDELISVNEIGERNG